MPNALPTLFADMKVGSALAIVGEFVAGSGGPGIVILTAEDQFDTTHGFAALLMLGLPGTLLCYASEFAETLLLAWQPSQRARHGNARG